MSYRDYQILISTWNTQPQHWEAARKVNPNTSHDALMLALHESNVNDVAHLVGLLVEDKRRLTTERDALLGACRAMLEVHGREWKFEEDGNFKGEYDCDCTGCEEARAAIAKATGPAVVESAAEDDNPARCPLHEWILPCPACAKVKFEVGMVDSPAVEES